MSHFRRAGLLADKMLLSRTSLGNLYPNNAISIMGVVPTTTAFRNFSVGSGSPKTRQVFNEKGGRRYIHSYRCSLGVGAQWTTVRWRT